MVTTWIPASRMRSTSSQRFSRGEPGTFVWASSSIRATVGWRAMTASVSISSTTTPRYSMRRRGTTSRPSSRAAVLRPAVRPRRSRPPRRSRGPCGDGPPRASGRSCRRRAPSRGRRGGARARPARIRPIAGQHLLRRGADVERVALAGLAHRRQPVQVEVDEQDVDPRLAQEAEQRLLGVAGDRPPGRRPRRSPGRPRPGRPGTRRRPG